MPASQEQKVDFLLKKIGYSASKTGIAEDESTISSSSNTAKAPFEEGIASPLVIPSTSILSDSTFIPTTPPGSDTAYVKGYRTATALRMTRDATVGTNTRSYIAYTTYNDTSSARLTNWIDTQFGASYIVKVYKGDPNSSGVELQQAGANNKTDGWFFDYSSGVLNFNGVNLPSGITATNIYIVGYRYIGATGVQPPAGIGTFHDLVVSNNLSVGGISTFTGAIDANGDLDVDGHTNLDNVSVAGVTTFSSNTIFPDGVSAKFGTDSDGEVKHTGSNLQIQETTGNIQITNYANDKDIVINTDDGSGGTTTYFKADGSSGETLLYHYGNEKIKTTSTGVTVTGTTETQTLNVTGVSTFAGTIDANGIIEATAGQNKIPSLYQNFSDLPNAGTYHGMFAHVHALGRGYFAHGGAWYELVNKESNGVVGTGTEKYNLGFTDTVNLKVTGITTLGSIGISTGIISGPSVTYIDPAAVGDNTGTVVIKGDLQIDGTQTIVNSSTMTVTDKNIEMAVGAANDAAADGGGITVKSGDGDKTWRWLNGTDSWTSSEHIRIPDGKVFGFASDTNTYIGRPAADVIAFTNGGGEKVRIASDGDVGIGTDNPDQKLHVYNGAGDVTSFVEAIAGDALLNLSNSGNGNYSGINFIRERGSGQTGINGGSIFMPSNTANNEAFLYIQAQSTSAHAGQTGALSDSNGVRLKLHGDDGIFSIETGSSERLRIASTGNIGIETSNPQAKLHISGTGTNDIRIDSNATALSFHNHSEFMGFIGNDSGKLFINAGGTQDTLLLQTGGTERLRINNVGDVGIGSDSTGGARLRVHQDGTDTLLQQWRGNLGSTAGERAFNLYSPATDNNFDYFRFQTGNAIKFQIDSIDALCIDDGGKVGIGTDDPQALLHLRGTGGNTSGIRFENDGGKSFNMFFTNNGSTSQFNLNYGGTGQNDISFKNNGDIITNQLAGGLGIGTYSPSVKFEVLGDSNLKGNLNVTGVSTFVGVSTFQDNVSIAGVTTFAGAIDLNADLDVDGQTNLDDVSISGVTTVSGSVTAEDLILIKNNPTITLTDDNNNPDYQIGNINGVLRFQDTTNNATRLGISTIGNIGINSTTPTALLDVNGNLNVSGISTLSKEVGIGSALNVVGLSTFQDHVRINKDKQLIFDRFGTAKTLIRYNDTLVLTQIKNVSEGLEIGYRPAHLMWLTNRVLSTKLGGIHVHGDLETDSVSTVNLNSTGISTFAGKVSAGGTTGTDGYYLQSTGVGVTWAQFPTMRTNQVFTATADQTTFPFSYNVGFLDVFVNGVKLPTSEFTASNGSSVILDDGCFVNDTVELISYNTVPSSGSGAQTLNQLDNVTITGVPVIGETLQHNGSAFVNDYTPSATTTSTSQTAILSLPIATYRSAEYTIQVTEGTKYHVTKILAIHDGTNVTFNEYGTLTTSTSLSTFALDVHSGNMRLLVTPASTNSTVFKVKFTAIKV